MHYFKMTTMYIQGLSGSRVQAAHPAQKSHHFPWETPISLEVTSKLSLKGQCCRVGRRAGVSREKKQEQEDQQYMQGTQVCYF
jgi:hypothetical protein